MPTTTVPLNNHIIAPQAAIEMTERYRNNREGVLATNYQSLDILPLSDTINKEAFRDLMDDDDCKAFRIYYGMDENLKLRPIIVGVNEDNEDNEDLLPPKDNLTTNDYFIINDTQRCPPLCPPQSYLNEDE
jgi:hypothetical protein